MRISDLAKDSFVLFHREGAPRLFDTITGMCTNAGFSPLVECEPNMMQTVLTLVAAEQGVSIVPACVRNLRADGVRFYRLLPDDVRVELVAAWKKDNITAPVRAFLDLTDAKAPMIRKKAEIRWPNQSFDPPSTGMLAPVIQRALSEAKKTITSATSSGLPIRFNACIPQRRDHSAQARALQHQRVSER